MDIRLKVVMIGADRSVHGGVSAVVNNYYKAGLDRQVTLRYIGTMVDGSRLRKLLQAVWAYFTFLFHIHDMDILHVHMAADASFYRKKVFIDTAALFRRRILIHEHGGDFQGFYYDRASDKTRAAIRRTLNKAQVFIVLSEEWEEFFKPLVDPDKLIILQNAVFIPSHGKADYRNQNMLFLGRLCREKGIGELLNVMPQIAAKYPEVKLYLGGIWEDDALRMQAEKLADHVVYLGWVSDDVKTKYIDACSMFVLPTWFEGQPIALLEAMAGGMAVLSTRVGGIPQIIQDGTEGLLIAPQDEQALLDGLCGMLGDDRRREHYGSCAARRIRADYNIEDSVARLVNIYENMAEEDPTKSATDEDLAGGKRI